MIRNTIRGDIFRSDAKHIAFAINCEGTNGAGVAGAVARIWPDIQYTGPLPLGTVVVGKDRDPRNPGRVFYGLVVHGLGDVGWSRAPEMVTKCLDLLDVPNDEPIACVFMGTGPVGQMMGADPEAIRRGIEASVKTIDLYSL